MMMILMTRMRSPLRMRMRMMMRRRNTYLRPTLLLYPLSTLFPQLGKAFETDESAPTPRSPQIRIPFAQTRLHRARKNVILEPPMSPSMEARIAEYDATPTPPSPPPSPLSPWSSPLPHIPSPPLPPLPSSLHLPPPVPTSLPLPSSPLPPLPSLLSHYSYHHQSTVGKRTFLRPSYHLIRGYVRLLPHQGMGWGRVRLLLLGLLEVIE
ncbi:hypothetical protein Tco_0244692 [Tanacetum coccineum]